MSHLLARFCDQLAGRGGYVALVALTLGLIDATAALPVAAACAVALISICRSVRIGALIIVMFAIGSQFSSWHVENQESSQVARLFGHTQLVKATLLEHLRSRPFGGYSAAVKLDSGAKVQLSTREAGEASSAPIGSQLSLRGKFEKLKPGQQYLVTRGISAQVFTQKLSLTGQNRGGFVGFVDQLRSKAEGVIGIGLGKDQAALARGMVLGQDAGLSDLARDEFKTTGLTHLVAASGQNILLVVGILIPIFSLIGLRRWIRVLLLLLAIAIYVPLAGGGPSIQRAGIMGAIGCVGLLVGRNPLRWYSLLVGAVVTLMINPYAYEDVGWQLSFAAVIGIFLLSAPLSRIVARVLPGGVAELVGVTLAATAATAPVILLTFGQLSWVSVPTNIAVAPAVGPVMLLGALTLLTGAIDGRLAMLVNALNQFPLAYIQAVAHTGAALAVAPIPLVGSTPQSPAQPTVSFLAVGQGDATLFQAGDKTVLVDTGPPGGPIIKELRDAGVKSIDLLVITHPEADHEGQAANLIDHFPVGVLLDGGYGASGPERQGILTAAGSHHVERRIPSAGEEITVGAISLSLLWPTPEAVETATNPNDRAIVAVARVKGLSVLLTADAESNVTGNIDLPHVDVLKVAHHGSTDVGLPDLLKRVQPQRAVIEVGTANTYGHPARETLRALKTVPRVDRTDQDGTVKIVGD